MNELITGFQILVSVLLVAAIVIQSRGTGLGTAWGGTGEFYRSKRGVEKILFIVTIVLATLFLITSIVNIVID